MLDVLLFSDPHVKQKLFERVDRASRPLVVTQVRQDRFARPVPEREPFATFDRRFGEVIDLLVVADDGTTEGMWRDPVGDLADRCFPGDRAASYAAASGYLFVQQGRALGVVKKHAVNDDLWFLQEQAARIVAQVPPPDPAQRPGHRRKPARSPEGRTEPPSVMTNVVRADPWQVLGIAPGTGRDEAKKAFRTLIAQYHPDKVAHLGPEFRELADRKTREILDAWETIEAEVG